MTELAAEELAGSMVRSSVALAGSRTVAISQSSHTTVYIMRSNSLPEKSEGPSYVPFAGFWRRKSSKGCDRMSKSKCPRAADHISHNLQIGQMVEAEAGGLIYLNADSCP